MKKFLIWSLAAVITLCAAYYQRITGPTYPKKAVLMINGLSYTLRLTRSISLEERSEIRLGINDTTIKAVAFFRKFRSDDEYQISEFKYKVYPVHLFLMNRIFGIKEEKGFYASLPPQPRAGKLQYYIRITDLNGTRTLFKETPVVVRFKGGVPWPVLLTHVVLMFLAMFLSTVAGLMAAAKVPAYRKYGIVTLVTLLAGGIILGSVVQKYAFGELWTGVPSGWDLTDNKTLIALLFWILAVVMNGRKDKPVYSVLAAIVLLLVFSIPHSALGSEFNYATGHVTQGIIVAIFPGIKKNLNLSAALILYLRLFIRKVKERGCSCN